MTSSAPASTPPLAFSDRGALSRAVIAHLTGSGEGCGHAALAEEAVAASADIARDDDIQLALFVLYASAYGSLPQLDPDLEWDPALVTTRRILEAAFERELRAGVPMPSLPEPTVDAVGRSLFALAEADTGPSLSRYFVKKATATQAQEMLIQRSAYTLREADPHSWAIPDWTDAPRPRSSRSSPTNTAVAVRTVCTPRSSRAPCGRQVSMTPTVRMSTTCPPSLSPPST